MAEIAGTFVQPLVELILGKIGEEASLLLSYKSDFDWLKSTMMELSGYMEDVAYSGKHRNKSVRLWLASVEKASFDAEDIIDQVLLHKNRKKVSPITCFSVNPEILFKHRIGKKIKELKNELNSIEERARRIGLVRTLQSSLPVVLDDDGERLRSSILYDEATTVGMEGNISNVIEKLRDPQVSRVMVVGMGGLGKTLLLQHVFKRIKLDYECSAWECISQYPVIPKIQSGICHQISMGFNSDVSEEVTARNIHEHLTGKKCLIVLDDIWEENGLLRKIGLPEDSTCKVLISSRNLEVAYKTGAFPYMMATLSQEDSKELFRRHAYPDLQEAVEEVKDIADEIIKCCKGLPLALKTTAASLRDVSSPDMWRFKLEEMKSVAGGDGSQEGSQTRVLEILRLSYEALPSYLKSCFVCLGLFREDFVMRCSKIISLWLSQGLLSDGQGGDKNAYKIGQIYLRKLSNRCMLDVVEESKWLEQKIKMHDLLHEMACQIFIENNGIILNATSENNSSTFLTKSLGKSEDCLRMTVFLGNMTEFPKEAKCSPSLRTLSMSESVLETLPNSFLRNPRSLRILDLSFTKISMLPECVGKLKLLRCLDLSETKIEEVPKCLRHLVLLRSLHLSHIQELPPWIGELDRLRELTWNGDVYPPKGMSRLINLCKLGGLKANGADGGEWMAFSQFSSFVNLWELKLTIQDEAAATEIGGDTLAALINLRRFTIGNASTSVQAKLGATLPERVKDLQYLYANRFELPKSIVGFCQLQELVLFKCKVNDYKELGLERLPLLRYLWIEDDEQCEEFPEAYGREGAFPKLEALKIAKFGRLKKMPKIERGGMPLLKFVTLKNCWELQDGEGKLSLIEFLEAMVSLEELSLFSFPADVKDSLMLKFPHLQIT